MKPANLLVLAQGFTSGPQRLLAAFEAQLSEREVALDEVKQHEASSVVALVRELQAHGAKTARPFEGFAFSFRIPQISSEFDLLKIADKTVVNIELKSEDVGASRVRRQLARNRTYLAPLERETFTFSFVLSKNALFELDDSGSLRKVSFYRLVDVLRSAGTAYDGTIEELFKVSNYLVSPLNDTRKFLEGAYFLTNHQEHIKARFLDACANRNPQRPPAFIVYGDAGTGKTLLLYDVARSLPHRRGRRVCVIHCGLLSPGHELLNDTQDAFAVLSAKHSERATLRDYTALLVDEAQRMWPSQLRHVVEEAAKAHIPLYLSLDRRQVLEGGQAPDVENVVRDAAFDVHAWELSHKIRTNRDLVDFIRSLFGLRGGRESVRTRHVKVSCAADAHTARQMVDAFRLEGHQYIVMDGPAVEGCPTPHTVVGQEFDKVVMAVGPGVDLQSDYRHRQLLYQGLTRARSDIALVVYQNDALLERLLTMLA